MTGRIVPGGHVVQTGSGVVEVGVGDADTGDAGDHVATGVTYVQSWTKTPDDGARKVTTLVREHVNAQNVEEKLMVVTPAVVAVMVVVMAVYSVDESSSDGCGGCTVDAMLVSGPSVIIGHGGSVTLRTVVPPSPSGRETPTVGSVKLGVATKPAIPLLDVCVILTLE